MSNMRCAVWIGGREFQIEERPVPEPGLGQVRVGVHACGVCLTDVHFVDGYFGENKPPRVLGHEYGGVIEAVGPGVAGLEIGTPVICLGAGGFAEQIVLPTERVFPIPPDLPLDRAAQAEPLVACLAAVQDARLPLGATVLITGAGPMGLTVLQLARRGGAARAFVSEPDPGRRQLAGQLGADATIDPAATSLPAAIKELTRGAGVDVAFEAAGHPAPLADCLDVVKDNGLVTIVGVNRVEARLDLELYRHHPRNLTLKWSWGPAGLGGFARAIPAAIPWLGQLELDPLISHRFDLADIAEAFDVARSRKGLKVLVYARRA